MANLDALILASVPLKLLRSKDAPFLLTFLDLYFKQPGVLQMPEEVFVARLIAHLQQEGYRISTDEPTAEPDLEHQAQRLRQSWLKDFYIQTYYDEQLRQPVVGPSKHAEKALQVIDLLREREFVGTNSRFKDIFDKLRQINEKANPDKEARLAELARKRQEIEDEIIRIETTGQVTLIEDFEIKEQLETLQRQASELVGDFGFVAEKFRAITQQLYQVSEAAGSTRGRMLRTYMDARYELGQTDQGKSFYAFMDFLLADQSQLELEKLTQHLYELLAERHIEPRGTSLITLPRLLYEASRRVDARTTLLAHKLNRAIAAQQNPRHAGVRQLTATILADALTQMSAGTEPEAYIALDEQADVYLPMEYMLNLEHTQARFQTQAALQPTLEDLAGLEGVFRKPIIDSRVLAGRIAQLVADRGQITLGQVVAANPIQHGLAELLAYAGIAKSRPHTQVDEQLREQVIFSTKNEAEEDSITMRTLSLPTILFT